MVGSWLGECLPDRALLQRWQREHPRHPARHLWAKALARTKYESLIFIKRDILDTWPSCTQEEAMSMRQTDLHDDYPAYRKQLLAVLATLPPGSVHLQLWLAARLIGASSSRVTVADLYRAGTPAAW
jgi:hypothetical protein